jgi:hypothetical protein
VIGAWPSFLLYSSRSPPALCSQLPASPPLLADTRARAGHHLLAHHSLPPARVGGASYQCPGHSTAVREGCRSRQAYGACAVAVTHCTGDDPFLFVVSAFSGKKKLHGVRHQGSIVEIIGPMFVVTYISTTIKRDRAADPNNLDHQSPKSPVQIYC